MARARRQPVAPPLRELPVVDPTRCTGVARCVEACPTEALAMAGKLPWLPRPLDCVACGLCVDVCPADALSLARVE